MEKNTVAVDAFKAWRVNALSSAEDAVVTLNELVTYPPKT